MSAGQDWCLQCGAVAGATAESRRWGPATTILALTALLALGAAAAAYAALSQKARRAPVLTTTVAQATPPATVPPATTPASPGTPTTVAPLLPTTKAKPPKIPLQTPTPKATVPTTPPATSETPSPSTSATGTTPSSTPTGGASSEPQPILLDTNAASTYNPYAYPASDFGDPSLTIDGDTSTGWTAIVKPETAPKMAEGVLVELKTPRRVSALKLVTSTPGMTVQVYGANGKTVPASITDPAWTTLSRSMTIHRRHARIALDKPKRSFAYLALWISRAPAGAGRVTVNELELLPAS